MLYDNNIIKQTTNKMSVIFKIKYKKRILKFNKRFIKTFELRK